MSVIPIASDDVWSVTPVGHQDSRHGRHPSAAVLPSVKAQEFNDDPLKSAKPETLCCLSQINFREVIGLARSEGEIWIRSDSTEAIPHE